MKKLIYLLIMCIVMTAFYGCSGSDTKNSNGEKTANVVALISSSGFDSDCVSVDDVNINKEFENWYSERYGEVSRQEPAEEITVQFDGKEYTGKYQYTNTYFFGKKGINNYYGDFGIVQVDAVDGSILNLVTGGPPTAATAMSEKTYEACRKKAQEIAEQYIDTSYFTFEVKESSVGVKFSYIQYVNNQPTQNRLSVLYDFSGRMESFSCYVSNGYKNISKAQKSDAAKLVDTFNSEKTQQAVIEQVKPAFADYKVSKYEIQNPKLFVMPDGKLVQSYLVKATIVDENPIKDETGELSYRGLHASVQVAVVEQ